MGLPAIRGVIRRRLLLNYRVDPDRIRPLLPPGLRPLTLGGWSLAGICLIRLEELRPEGLPAWLGTASENAAHRIAVAWDGGEGVYVPRRDTDAALNRLAGGLLFPGTQHAATFDVAEGPEGIRAAVRSRDGVVDLEVAATEVENAPETSILGDLAEASAFFRRGGRGWSPGRKGGLEGLELRPDRWSIRPLEITRARASFFDDPVRFPPGTAVLDSAFLMRDLPHTWHELAPFPGGAR